MIVMGSSAIVFNPATLFNHLYWTDGPEMIAKGYADSAALTVWPDEVGTADANVHGGGTYRTPANSGFPGHASATSDGNVDSWGPPSWTGLTTWSAVVIANVAAASGYLMDGAGASNRAIIGVQTGAWRFYAGSNLTGGTASTGLHGFVGRQMSVGNDTLDVDGVRVCDGNAGSHSLTGVTIAGPYDHSSSAQTAGSYFLVGTYDGDVTADGNWGIFKAWVLQEYNVTL